MARPDHQTHTRDIPQIMGCPARVTVVGGGAALLVLAETELRTLEGLWSRQLPTSEVSLLNLAAGNPVPLSARTRLLVRQLIQAHDATDGAFDPTRVLELVALSYGGSRHDDARITALPTPTLGGGDVRGIVIDDARACVLLPAGTALDPWGLSRGLAADLVSETLLGHGACGALVSVGGDVRVTGRSPHRHAWGVDVEDPRRPNRTLRRLAVGDGGVATSSAPPRHRTGAEGTAVHHVIDPTADAPTGQGITAATVVAGTAAWAEALATACLTLAPFDALDLLTENGVAGLLVRGDGGVIESVAWHEFAA